MGGRGSRSLSGSQSTSLGGKIENVQDLDSRIRTEEEKMDDLRSRMSELASSATPGANHDDARAEEYYSVQRQYNIQREKVNTLLDMKAEITRKLEAERNRQRDLDREHVRQREREITTTTYERAQKRLQRQVDTWFGINRR